MYDFKSCKYVNFWPYVGKDYATAPHKILVLGESHYGEQKLDEYHEWTQEVGDIGGPVASRTRRMFSRPSADRTRTESSTKSPSTISFKRASATRPETIAGSRTR